MSHKVNLVRVLTAATGNSSPIQLDAAYSQLFMTPAEAGAMNGRVYSYLIVDGNNWEYGRGVYTSSGNTLARNVIASRIGGTLGASRISLSGTAQVRFVEIAEDMDGVRGTRAVTGTSDTLVNSDQGYVVTYSNASAVAVSLAQAGASGLFLDGWATFVKNKGAGAVTITPATSTIDGAATLVLAQNQGAMIWSDGTNYQSFRLGTPVVGTTAGTVAAGDDARFGAVADDIRQNALLGAIYQSKSIADIFRGILRVATGFKAASDAANGINVSLSTNYTVSSSSGYVTNAYTPTLISQAAGTTIGTLTGGGGLAAAFTGALNKLWSASANEPSGSISSGWVGKNYSSSPKKIQQIKVYGSSDLGFDGTSGATTVTITVYAKNGSSPGNGTDGTVIGTLQSFSDAASLTKTFTSNNNTTAWDYVWVNVTTTAAQTVVSQVEFYEPTPTDTTIATVYQTTDASVSGGRVLIEFDNVATPTLNTDITVEVTCNGGTNWTAAALSHVSAYGQGGRRIVETVDQACIAGTSFAARIKTFNSKVIPIYGITVTAKKA